MIKFRTNVYTFLLEVIEKGETIGWPSIQQYVVRWKNPNDLFSDIDVEDKVSEELFMSDIRLDIEKMQSFMEIYETVKSDPQLSKRLLVDAGGSPLKTRDWEISWLYGTIGAFITSYLVKANRKINRELFDHLFDDFEREIITNEAIYIKISPLYNLHLRVDEIVFTGNLKIRKLKESELEQWANSPIFPMLPDQIAPLQCALELKLKADRNANNFNFQILQDQILQALRLFYNTNIYIPFTYEFSESYFDRTIIHNADVPERMRDRIEIFEQNNFEEIKEIWSLLHSGINNEKLALAIRRWSNSFGRSSHQDKIIDYWIGLESLITPESNQEIKFRASLRIAKFIGEHSNERRLIYDQMRRSYDRRSEIVHGSTRERDDLEEVSKYTGNYLRGAIKKILIMNHPFNPTDIDLSLIE